MVFEDGLKFKKKKRTTTKKQEKQKPVSAKSVEGELEVYGLAMPEAAGGVSADGAPGKEKLRPLKIPTVRLKEL